jgi:hypothetical protein
LKLRALLLGLAVFGFFLACRTADLITNVTAPRATSTVVALNKRTSHAPQAPATPTRRRGAQNRPTAEPTSDLALQEPTEPPLPIEELPTEPPPPTDIKPPTRPPQPTAPPSPSGPTFTPVPTPCSKTYCAVFRGCQPEGNTLVEGIVYNNGVPENGVAVRVALAQGAYPLVPDFPSGTEAVNPGKPDPNNPGHYILQIVAGEAREGHWWVFVVDKVNGTRQISDAIEFHTNDDPNNPANCQHAFVDFSR